MSFNQNLQKKFPHLEVSVLTLSQTQKDNETRRIDSEFFRKEYLENEEFLKNLSVDYESLGNLIIKMTGGATPLGADYPENGIPFLRVQNIMQNYFNLNDIVYINSKDDEILKRSRLKLNDVLLTITGAYGKAAVVENDLVGANINQHSVKIEVKDINPYFLSTFLNSKFGQLQCDKKITGVTRPALDYQVIKTFLIPLLPMPFQLEIEKLVKDSHQALEQSKALYKEAETLLYVELGLDPTNPMQSILSHSCHSEPALAGEESIWDSSGDVSALPQHDKLTNFTIKTLKETFLKTGRLDSEYYQSKYDKIETFIKSYKRGFSKLEITEIKDSNFIPKSKENYRYIELANIGANGNISSPLEELGELLPTRARRLVKEGDLIISSIEGSLSSCALITKEFDNCIVSTGFYVLKSQSINSETLLVLFKSKVFQDYLKKFPSGTILTAISKEELQNILIPKIDFNIQKSIAQHIQTSFTLRTEAKNLLNTAKQQVEEAIKNGGGGQTMSSS